MAARLKLYRRPEQFLSIFFLKNRGGGDRRQSSGQGDTLAKIRRASRTAGIEFIDENGDGPDVRLRKHD
jgi:hypothetical protein